MDEIITKIVKLPMTTKVVILAVLVGAITALTFFQFVKPTKDSIASEERTLARERNTLIERQAIANNLNQYNREMEELEQRLEDALTEMPAETRMDDLIAQLAEIADKAGLELSNITPQPETREDTFYYRIPVRMQVSGTYHEIAVFLDMISKLRRIVNVTNIQIGSPRVEAEKIVLQASYLATTFRFSEEAGRTGTGDASGSDDGRGR